MGLDNDLLNSAIVVVVEPKGEDGRLYITVREEDYSDWDSNVLHERTSEVNPAMQIGKAVAMAVADFEAERNERLSAVPLFSW
jgi:hypothetical protein